MGQAPSRAREFLLPRAHELDNAEDSAESVPIRFTIDEIPGTLTDDSTKSWARQFYSEVEWNKLEDYQRATIFDQALEFRNLNKHDLDASDASEVPLNMDEPDTWAAINDHGSEEWPPALRKTRYKKEEVTAWKLAMHDALCDQKSRAQWGDRFYAGEFEVGTTCEHCLKAGKTCIRNGRGINCTNCRNRSGRQRRCSNLRAYYVAYASQELNIDLRDAQARYKIIGGPGAKGTAPSPCESSPEPIETPQRRNTRGSGRQAALHPNPKSTRTATAASPTQYSSHIVGKTTRMSSIRKARQLASASSYQEPRSNAVTTSRMGSPAQSEASSVVEIVSEAQAFENSPLNPKHLSSVPSTTSNGFVTPHTSFSPSALPQNKGRHSTAAPPLRAKASHPYKRGFAPFVSYSTSNSTGSGRGPGKFTDECIAPTPKNYGIKHPGANLSDASTSMSIRKRVDPEIEDLKLKIKGLQKENQVLRERHDGLRDLSNQLSRHIDRND